MHRIGIFLLLIVGVSFASCSDYDSAAEATSRERLEGEWKLVRVVNENEDNLSPENLTYTFDGEIFIYKSDLFTYDDIYSVFPGFVSFNGDTYEILSLGDTEMVLFDGRGDSTQFYEKVN